MPGVSFVPKPLLVRYPELDHEPRVAGVYLRVYVGGADVSARGRGVQCSTGLRVVGCVCAALG